MRFEPRHAFRRSKALADASPVRPALLRSVGRAGLPLEIAFLLRFHVDRSLLEAAAAQADAEGLCAARVLLASGTIATSFFYRALACHLNLRFTAEWPVLAPLADGASFGAALRAGRARLASAGTAQWIVAPEDETLRRLLADRNLDGSADIVITTPAHLAALLQFHHQDVIERTARDRLPDLAPWLSARGAVNSMSGVGVGIASGCVALGLWFAPRIVGDLFGLMFLAGMLLKLVLTMAARASPPHGAREIPARAELPIYTILVPLRGEAEMIPDLLSSLGAIDYPRTKLDCLLLVEPEDLATRDALAAARLPPWIRVIFGPLDRTLRTKPRALNLGLMNARGSLLTVYDAEDRPAPDQLLRAAAIFANTPKSLACLQARLCIDNGDASLLARLFAIEYAALFDVLNVGTTRLGLPLALGGTSNHFRVSALHAVGGWDAWNVTEDADLGLRFAQFDYAVKCFASTTLEAAPDRLAVWMKQRRRWTKGWMQTALVLARDAPCAWRRFGAIKSTAVALLLVNLVVGPLLFPIFYGFVGYHVVTAGWPASRTLVESAETGLALLVMTLGLCTPIGFGYAGIQVRRLWRFSSSLPLLLVYQIMISVAVWLGFIDLMLRPYHWHKTVHHPLARDTERFERQKVRRYPALRNATRWSFKTARLNTYLSRPDAFAE